MGLDSTMTLFLLLWQIFSVNTVLVSGTGLAAINLKMNLKVENDTIVLKECATGWTPFKEHCYQYFDGYSKNRTYTWLAARDECISHEADLVSIHSKEETDFLTDLVQQRVCSRVWIGLQYYFLRTIRQIWSDGSPIDFVNHHKNFSGTPDGFGEYYLHPGCYSSSMSGQWGYYMDETQSLHSYFCKKSTSPAPRSCSSCVQPSHFSDYTMPEVVTGADGCKSLSCEGYEMMVVEGADWDYDFFEKEVRCSPRGMWESSSGYGGNGTYKQVDDARNLITCAYPVKA